ncbi:Putative archaetidylserine decarboxylase proenzyme [uncultured archaeon]|nr:Putative archaetidylserine decarboxylase proenzyme [uncultured archaeon]
MRLARGSAAWISLPLFLTAALAFLGSWYISAMALVGSIFMLFFHRDPDRLPRGEGMIAPADGRIIAAAKSGITIFMGPSDVHVNRAPLAGTVRETEHIKGGHFPAFLARAKDNQQNRIILETSDGDVELRQITGTLVREIVCYVRPGDRVARGDRIGMIRFGSRVEVTMPKGYGLQIKLGDKVRAGETVIAVKRP